MNELSRGGQNVKEEDECQYSLKRSRRDRRLRLSHDQSDARISYGMA